jgi:hypothetical protein
MKQIFLMITLLISIAITAQTEYKSYVTMRTYHFEMSKDVLETFNETEGGNIGIIFIRSEKVSKNSSIQQHFGAIRNSYGDLSIVGQVAYVYHINNFDLGGSIGLISGYEKAYKYMPNTLSVMPDIFRNNGILPSLNINFSYTRYKIQPLVIISPTYINGGVLVKLN